MSSENNLISILSDIADAIRGKIGVEGEINPQDFSLELFGISTATLNNSMVDVSGGGVSLIEELSFDTKINTIEEKAFAKFTNLKKVHFSANITDIKNNAFQYCRSLQEFIFEDGSECLNIGKQAFLNCEALTEFNFPNKLESIYEDAFISCISLKSVIIPKSVTNIIGNVFKACHNIESISVESGNTTYDSRDNCNAIIETSTGTLISGFKNTSIPTDISTLGISSFYNNNGLLQINIPGNILVINGSAFGYCQRLASVTLNTGLKKINGWCFSNCISLTEISLPNTVETIRDGVFYGCSKLKVVDMTSLTEIPTLGANVFEKCHADLQIKVPNTWITKQNLSSKTNWADIMDKVVGV